MNDNRLASSTSKGDLTDLCGSVRLDVVCEESSVRESQDGYGANGSPAAPCGVRATKTAGSSGDHEELDNPHAQHDNQTCDFPGCKRMAEGSQMSQDGKIDRICAEHKSPVLVIPTAVTRAACCEHPGCSKTPRYGTQDGFLTFCQGHKKKGMFTVRDGQLFVATRDGRAFRGKTGTTTVGAGTAAGVAMATASTAEDPSADGTASLPEPGSHNAKSRSGQKEIKDQDASGLFPRTSRKSSTNAATKKAEQKPQGDLRDAAAAGEKAVKRPAEGKGPARSTGSARKAPIAGIASQMEAPTLPSMSSELPALAPSVSAREKQNSKQLPPSGLTPSDEMRMLQEAREAARAEAAASGSGRRPRAPSRKLLEASGKLIGDSIQWMTKGKREEEARMKSNMKAQRKAAAVAGLKFGQFIEALALSSPIGAKPGVGGGEDPGAGDWSGVNAAVSSVFWRKLTPAETVQAAEKQSFMNKAELNVRDGKARATGAEGVATKEGNGVPFSEAAASETKSKPWRKRRGAASTGQPIVTVDGMKNPKRRRHSRCKAQGGVIDGGSGMRKVRCISSTREPPPKKDNPVGVR